MPGISRAIAAARLTSASMSRPAVGRTWMVTSRETFDCHSLAAERTMTAAPEVKEARNVMMATTARSARPEIVACGTIGDSKRGPATAGAAAGAGSLATGALPGTVVSLVDMQPAFVQHQTARVVLVHQGDVVRRDHHRRPRFVELDEQAQEPLRKARIDVAGRLVGEQKLRPRNHRPRDGGALLLAAREHRR